MFLKATDVAEVMNVSVPYAYKLIRQMNDELKAKGYITMRGRIDSKYFYEHFYGTRQEGGEYDAGI